MHVCARTHMYTHAVGLCLSREEEGALQSRASVIEEDITFLPVQPSTLIEKGSKDSFPVPLKEAIHPQATSLTTPQLYPLL